MLGVIGILSFSLFIFPRTGVVGTQLLVAFLGGAIAIHLQHQEPVIKAILVHILVVLTAVIRFPELIQRAV